jgi:hypothetical protein
MDINDIIDYLFHPSRYLDSYLYSVYLEYASAEELEKDILFIKTHWELVKHLDSFCEEYNVWFVDNIAVTKDLTPPMTHIKVENNINMRRYYDLKNRNNPYNGAIIAPNIEV